MVEAFRDPVGEFTRGLTTTLPVGVALKERKEDRLKKIEDRQARIKKDKFDKGIKLLKAATDASAIGTLAGRKRAFQLGNMAAEALGLPATKAAFDDTKDFSAVTKEVQNAIKAFEGKTTAGGDRGLLQSSLQDAYSMARDVLLPAQVTELKAEAKTGLVGAEARIEQEFLGQAARLPGLEREGVITPAQAEEARITAEVGAGAPGAELLKQRQLRVGKAPTVPQQQAAIIADIREGRTRVEDLSELERGLVNKAIATGEISLSVDPDTGAISFSQGGGGLTKPTQSKAEQTFMSGQGLLGVVNDFRDILRPENVGLVGDIRQTVQGAIQQGGALASRLSGMGDDVMQAALANGDEINRTRWFDPNLTQMDFLSNIIAYKHAKTLDPSGRLSDRDLIEAKKSLGLEKKLVGIKDLATVLNGLEKITIRTMTDANALLKNRFTNPVSRAERTRQATGGAQTPEDEANAFLGTP